MITPKENRRQKLIAASVPEKFLDAIDNSSDFEDFEYLVCYPSSAYFYLPTIQNEYSILLDYEITPIFDGCNGDTFNVMLTKENEIRFIHFELENDEIYDDFGKKF